MFLGAKNEKGDISNLPVKYSGTATPYYQSGFMKTEFVELLPRTYETWEIRLSKSSKIVSGRVEFETKFLGLTFFNSAHFSKDKIAKLRKLHCFAWDNHLTRAAKKQA